MSYLTTQQIIGMPVFSHFDLKEPINRIFDLNRMGNVIAKEPLYQISINGIIIFAGRGIESMNQDIEKCNKIAEIVKDISDPEVAKEWVKKIMLHNILYKIKL